GAASARVSRGWPERTRAAVGGRGRAPAQLVCLLSLVVMGGRLRPPDRPGAVRAAVGLCPVVSDQAVRCTARGGCTTHPAVLVLRWRTWRAVPGAAEPVAQSGGRPPAPVSALLPATL